VSSRGVYTIETHIVITGGYPSPLLEFNPCNVLVEALLGLFFNRGVGVLICVSVYCVLCTEQ